MFSKAPIVARQFHIVGGGCFGSQYLRWLMRAKELGWLQCQEIRVLDRNAHCLAIRENYIKPPALLIQNDWVDYFCRYLEENYQSEEATQDHWVPSPLSPHILFLGFLRAAQSIHPEFSLNEVPFREQVPTPVQIPLPVGTFAVSFAEWKCPVNCIEPPRCPAIHEKRDWDMKGALEAHFLSARQRSAHVLQCRHLVHGVGTIPCSIIFSEFKKFLASWKKKEIQEMIVATVSGCHGLIGRADKILETQSESQNPDQKQPAS